MKVIPLQRFGLGDNIFTANLMSKFADAGYQVIYPVLPANVDALNKAYPQFQWVDYNSVSLDWNSRQDYEIGDTRYLPIRFANEILKVPYSQCMRAKFDMYGFNFQDWRNTMYQRDMKKELFLFNNTRDLMHGREYNLISRYYGSNSQFKADIKVNNGLPNIELTSLAGYSLFDWSYIIENATEIHAVSSSIFYLLELLTLKAKEVHLYGRQAIEPKTWVDNIEYLMTKNYILHR